MTPWPNVIYTLIDAATMLSICGAEVKLAYYLLKSFSGKTEGNPLSHVHEASPTPFCPQPSPADLNTPAAVIGCGAWEARNPRPLFAAHMENAGSGSHGVQGQRPQIRPGLTQVLRLMGKSPTGGLGPEHWRTSGTESPGVFAAQ